MKFEKIHMYAVKDDGKLIGIFTTPDAPEIERYAVEEICVWHIEGSRVRGDDVYLTEGSRTMIKKSGVGEFTSEAHETERWGANLQSAVTVLFRGWNKAEMKKTVRFKVNKVYPNGMKGQKMPIDACEEACVNEEPSQEWLNRDFYEEYLQEKREQAARARAYKSEEMTFVVDALMKLPAVEETEKVIPAVTVNVWEPKSVGSSAWYNTLIDAAKRRLSYMLTKADLKALAKIISEAGGTLPEPAAVDSEDRRLIKAVYDTADVIAGRMVRDIRREHNYRLRKHLCDFLK